MNYLVSITQFQQISLHVQSYFISVHHHAAATAAKSLQSCPTLRDPVDCSSPGSSVHGIFQARVLEWGATAFSVHPHIKLF